MKAQLLTASVALLCMFCGKEPSSGGTGPPPGNYTIEVGDDWHSYTSDAALIASGFFAIGTSFTVAGNVVRVNDPIFGQIARVAQPADLQNTTQPGWTPQYSKSFPRDLDRAWFRFRVRFSPGWTDASPYPAGAANAYKLAFMLWQGANGRSEVEYTNTDAYFPGFDF